MDRDVDAAVSLRLLDFVDRMADLVGVSDEQGRVLYLNETARKYLGFGETTDMTTADFFGPDVFQWYYDEVRPTLLRTGVWTGDVPIRTQAGELLPMTFSVVAGIGPGGEITGLVTHGRPRSAARPELDAPRSRAPDPTEVLDPAIMRDWVLHAFERAEQNGERVALVHARVRDLRRIVSQRGSFVADGVMRAAGRRLKGTVRASDVVARVGHDTFTLVFADIRDTAEALRHASAIQEAFDREPIWTASGEVPVSLALGLAVNDPGDGPEDLTARAEAAAIGAASEPKQRITVAGPHDAAVAAEYESLRLAVTAGDVRTYVMPVAGASMAMVGYEGFPRWAHHRVGTVESHALHELAEQVGVGSAIDLRVLRESTAVVATTPSDDALRVYAPISQALLADVYVEQYVWEIADAASLSTEQLHLLVEHRLVVERNPTCHDMLRSLRDNGCRLVVTDVDEHSEIYSLVDEHHICEIRVAEPLMQRSFGDREAHHRVERLVTLARDVGARVIAPSVRTADQYAAAREMGVEFFTGAFFGEPVPTDSIA